MSEDNPEETQTRLTRRDWLSVTGATVGAAIVGSASTGNAAAQTANEPRINLGDNFYIDDVDGSTLAIKEASDGSTVMEYDATEDEWTLPAVNTDQATIGTSSVAPELFEAASPRESALKLKPISGDKPGSMELHPSGSETRSHYIITNNPDPDNFGFVELEANGTESWLHAAQKGTGTAPTSFRFYGFPDGVNIESPMKFSQPASAELSSSQTIPDTGHEEIVFDTEVHDPYSNYDPATGRYTVPYDGVYEISANVGWSNLSSGNRSITSLIINGPSTPSNKRLSWICNGPQDGRHFTVQHDATAGDTLSVSMWQNSGSTADTLSLAYMNVSFKRVQ